MNYKIFKTDLKPWLKKFFFDKFSYIVKTITGTTIHIIDGIRKRIIESKMSKESSQETTTGKNKFNMFDFSVGSNVAIASLDAEKIVLTAEKTQGSQFVKNFVKNVDKTKNYVFSLKGKKTQAKGNAKNLRGYFYGSDDDINYTMLASMTIGGVENQEYSYSVSLTGYSNYRFYLYNYSDATVPLGETTEFYDIQFEEGTQQTEWEEFTNGPSPNPDYPQEIKTVKGYRNVFDYDTYKTYYKNGTLIENGFKTNSYETFFTVYANFLKPGKYYTVFFNVKKYGTQNNTGASGRINISGTGFNRYSGNGDYFLIPEGTTNIQVRMYGANPVNDDNYYEFTNIMFVEGQYNELPYVPYGTNYVYTKITNGTDTNYFTIPLNENEIAGTDSAHKDILLVDSDGHCYLEKNTRGLELAIADMDNDENYPGWKNQEQFKLDYPNMNTSFSSKGIAFKSNITLDGLAVVSNTVFAPSKGIIMLNESIFNLTQTQWKEQYPDLVFKILYALQTPEIIDLNYDVDIRLFKRVNNISNSDDMDMEIKYYSK